MMLRISPKISSLMLAVLSAIALYGLLIILVRAIGLETLHASVQQFGLWSPVIFVIACAVSLILAPMSASSVFVVGGLVFGQVLGFVLCFIGSILGCTANFWLSRKLGRKLAIRLVGKSSLSTLDRFTTRLQSHHGIVFMILIMPLSQDLVSYAVGLTKVKFSDFFVALTISAIAIAAIYAYLGSSLLGVLV